MQGIKVLTQEKYDSIPALLEQGLDRTQIAALFGVTPASLQVQCSRRGISLRQGGRRMPRRDLSLADAKLDLNQHVMIIASEGSQIGLASAATAPSSS
jgi:hypothetical protein